MGFSKNLKPFLKSMAIFGLIYLFIYYAVVAIVVYVVAVVIARVIHNYADLNPFGKPSRTIRKLSDPVLAPVRSYLIRMGFKPNLAPLLTILLAIFAGLTVTQVTYDVLFVLSGSILSVRIGSFTSLIGYILYGVLSLYSLMILLRIVFDWLMIFRGRLSRFLFVTTEPVLAPFRRIIPRIGMFDISPIVVFLLISILQRVVVSKLISSAFM